MRLSFFLFVPAFLFAGSAFAQSGDPLAVPTPVSNPPPAQEQAWNLLSGEALPLVIVDYFQMEYERVLSPTLGGISIRGRADYLWLGVFSLGDVGGGLHYDLYLPTLLHDPLNTTGPAGAFVQIGGDARVWHGTFRVPGYHAAVTGWDVEPNVYGGYRLVLGNFFLAPRAGVGYSFGGAHYVDDNGFKTFVSRTRGAHLHLDLMLGIAW